jgi:hypothetical protein
MEIGGIPEIKSPNQALHFSQIHRDNNRKFIIHKTASLPPLDLSRFANNNFISPIFTNDYRFVALWSSKS